MNSEVKSHDHSGFFEDTMPLYMRIENQVRRRIESGEWAHGGAIPTESALCAAYGASRITVRHALQRLVERGLLVREQGKGTYVRRSGITASTRSVRSFTSELQELDMAPSSRLLSMALVEAPANVSVALDLASSAEVVRIHRLRLGDDEPIGVQTAFLVSERFPGLADLHIEGRSLYELLATNYGLAPVEARETFSVGRATPKDAEWLKVASGSPVFLVERTTYDLRMPFEYVASVMRGDRYRVTVAIRNP